MACCQCDMSFEWGSMWLDGSFWGLSAGTVITKETKEPNNRVLLGALLFGCIVSFVLRNLCLGIPTEGTGLLSVMSV